MTSLLNANQVPCPPKSNQNWDWNLDFGLGLSLKSYHRHRDNHSSAVATHTKLVPNLYRNYTEGEGGVEMVVCVNFRSADFELS